MGDVFPLQALTRHVTLFAQTAGGKEYETVTVDHLGMVEDIRRRYYGIRCGTPMPIMLLQSNQFMLN